MSILKGVTEHSDDVKLELFGYIFKINEDFLEDYRWFAYDTQYNFTPRICKDFYNFTNFQNINFPKPVYLDNEKTDVLIADGYGWDQIECGFSIILRTLYRNYINNGGGYVGSCGGGDFPLPLYDKPNTPTEKYFIDKNSFIKDMNTRADVKMGFPIIAEYLGIKNRIIPIRPRGKLDPGAVGIQGYNYYNVWSKDTSPDNSPVQDIDAMNGIPVNLTDVNRTHPITKDYWGNSLFVLAMGGPSYIINDNYVSPLASYPSNFCEGNELQNLNVWSFTPKLHKFLKIFLTLFIINEFKQIYIDELPFEFQNLFKEGQEVTTIQELSYHLFFLIFFNLILF